MNASRRDVLKHAVAAALASAPLIAPLTAGAQQTPAKVKIGWQRGIQMPYQMARVLDLGKSANVAVEWTRFDSGPAMFPALQSGAVDLAQMGASPAIAAISNGLDVTVIGIVQDISRGEGLVGRTAAGINDVRGLTGKRVGVVVGSSSYMGLLAALRENGMKLSDISVINIGPAQMLPAFQNGDLDAVFYWDPYMTFAMNAGGKLVVTTHQLDDVPSSTASKGVWIVRNEFLKKNPDDLLSFLRVADLGRRTYLQKGEKSKFVLSRLASELNLEPAIVAQMADRVTFPSAADQLDPKNGYAFAAASPSSPMHIVEAMVELAKVQVQFGNIRKPLSAVDLSKYVDASMLRRLHDAPPLPMEGP